MRSLAARGCDRAWQPGAPCLGHNPMGQCIRRMGEATFPGPREGALGSGGKHSQYEVQSILWTRAYRRKPEISGGKGI